MNYAGRGALGQRPVKRVANASDCVSTREFRRIRRLPALATPLPPNSIVSYGSSQTRFEMVQTVMPAHEVDAILSLSIYITCLFLLFMSYKKGRTAWGRLYSIELLFLGKKTKLSGIYAGSTICTLGFGSYFIASITSVDSLKYLSQISLICLSIFYVLIYCLCYMHSQSKIRKNAIDQIEHTYLKEAYAYYNFYAAAFWFMALLGLIKIYIQFNHDVLGHTIWLNKFLQQTDFIASAWNKKFEDNNLMSVEVMADQYNEISRSLIKQLEPITFYALYWISVAIMINVTPIGRVIESTAKTVGYYIAPIFISVVIIASAWTYYSLFSTLSREAISFYQHGVSMEHSSSDSIRRLIELKAETLQFTGISGFFRIFTHEGGIYLVALAGLQALIGSLRNAKQKDQ
jgi:hypothetical protein